MTDPIVIEAEIIGDDVKLNSFVVFRPSKRFMKKYKMPYANYSAVVIGIQRLTKQPILRVFNPYAGNCELPKQQTLPKSVIKASLGPFELHTDLGAQSHMNDWTVWCDEQGTWGTWA